MARACRWRTRIRQLGISEVTYYRWRKEYGGMSGDQLRRLSGA